MCRSPGRSAAANKDKIHSLRRKTGPGHSTSQPGEGAVNLLVTEVRAAEQALRGLAFTFAAAVVSIYFYTFTS